MNAASVPKPSNPIALCFRGLGNLASKAIYLSANPTNRQPGPDRRVFFKYGIIQPDEITRTNLAFLSENGFFAADTNFFVVGSSEGEAAVRMVLGSNANVFNERDLWTSRFNVDIAIDFTFDAFPFIRALRASGIDAPVIVQSNNYGRGTLWVPPLKEQEKTPKADAGVFRAADCSLSGTIPVLARLEGLFRNLFINFMTDRNAGRAANSAVGNAFYFSDSFPRRKKQEFTALTRVRTLVTLMSSALVNPFYIATIGAVVDPEPVVREFGSWTRFERSGVVPRLRGAPQIEVCSEDNTSRHYLGPEPENVQEFSVRYPDSSKPFIVYFGRTFERMGEMISFKIGFDVNLTAAMSNIDLINAIAGLSR